MQKYDSMERWWKGKMRILRKMILLIILLWGVSFAVSAQTLSVEQQVYDYLTQDMGLPSASACGILANIEHESAFNVNALGDNGTSYGLCQWHAGRYASLKKYCMGAGLDYRTVEGQLEYLRYELENHYGAMTATLRMMEDTPDGAYQAGYIWCVQFERPANMDKKGVNRGILAKEKYWNRYNSVVVIVYEQEPLTKEEVLRIVRQKEIPVPQPPEETQGNYIEDAEEEPVRIPILHYIPRHRPRQEWHLDPAAGFAAAMVFAPLSEGKKERYELELPEHETAAA